jgi:hypothetical protein
MHRCNCNLEGCLQLSVNRIGEGINALLERIGSGRSPTSGISTSITRIGGGLIVNCGIVCTTGKDFTHEWFLVEEGYFYFSDGLKFKVLKDGISE